MLLQEPQEERWNERAAGQEGEPEGSRTRAGAEGKNIATETKVKTGGAPIKNGIKTRYLIV
jgi:hypothetical protein